MSTLKVQLGLTLAVLMTLSMFLFGIVLLILWQRNSLERETTVTEQFLRMASPSFSLHQNPLMLPSGVKNFIEENNIHCVQWEDETSASTQSHGTCPEHESLVPLMREAKQGTDSRSYSGMTWNGFFFSRQYLLMAISTPDINNKNVTIGVIRSLEKVSGPIKNIRQIFYAYLVINVLIFVTIGFIRLLHLVIRPIQRLSQLADSRTDLNDSAFFTGERWGEFTQLSSSLNRLVSRIDGDKQQLQTTVQSLKQANEELQNNRDEMIRTEKLASIGRLSAGLAHEIGNPLGIIQGYVDLLADDSLNTADRKVFSEKSVQELDRINGLIRNLLDLSRTPVTSAISHVNIHNLLRNIIDAVHIRKTAVTINYKTDFTAAKKVVYIDENGLRQVFLNCILNSIDAIEEQTENTDGQIVLETINESDNTITINIRDNGVGLDPSHLKSIFDPFFTTKEVGKGTGLGLAVAHNMIKSSGGSLHFSSEQNIGATISISLPTTLEQQEEL